MSDDAKRSIRRSLAGADRGLRVIEGGIPPVPPRGADDGDECPVTALGHRDGVFHFLDVRGQKRELSARQLGARHDLLALFGGDDTWLRARHPRRAQSGRMDDAGNPVMVTVDFQVNSAAAALQRACFEAGLFGDHVLVRRPGIWPGPDGAPAVHCGDVVLLGDAWVRAGTRTGAQVWAAAPPSPRPALGCDVAPARALLDDLRQYWQWREAGGPVAVLGLLANAYLGAATRWRPAGFVTGDTGSGKSALLRVIRAALPLHHHDNDASKAGIEQAIAGRAMPILIDEASDRANRGAARDLVDLVLSASGDEGTRGTRGTADGRGRRIELVGLIIMFSINPPELEPQHLGRLTVIDLAAAADGEDFREQHEAIAARVREVAPALWGRALASWERYGASLASFRAGLLARQCAPREMDQAGALLAGWWILTHEGMPDARAVAEGIAALDGYVRSARAVQADSRPRRALNHLLTALVQVHRSTDRDPVGKLIEIALGMGDAARSPDAARDALADHGVRVVRACVRAGTPPPLEGCGCVNCREGDGRRRAVPRLSDGAGIWLANRHAELSRLFAGSPFDGEKWRSELGRLAGAKGSGRNVRVGSYVGYALWLPAAALEEEEAGAPDG